MLGGGASAQRRSAMSLRRTVQCAFNTGSYRRSENEYRSIEEVDGSAMDVLYDNNDEGVRFLKGCVA